MMSPNVIGPIMAAVLECADASLTLHERPVGRKAISPGLPAVDECCDGFLYVRLGAMFPTGNPFPQVDSRPGTCKPTMIGSTIYVGVYRCIAVIDDNGVAPTAAEITADGEAMVEDASILLEAIKCCVAGLVDDQDTNALALSLGTWLPLEPDGGCAGGEWPVTIGHGTCGCPEV